MAIEVYVLYLAALAVFFATPPDTSQLLVASNSIRFGLRRSTLTIAGDLTANSLQMTAAAFGLATVITSSADAFHWIKWCGVLYLTWVGLRLILTKEKQVELGDRRKGSSVQMFRQGFITSMANPFAVVFFGALFPQFIEPELPVFPQLLILGLSYIFVDGAILIAWGWLGIRAAYILRSASIGVINKICGSLMMAAAFLLGLKDIETQR